MSVLAALEQSGVKPEALLKRLQAEQERRVSVNKLALYKPYAKQLEFHALGASHRERMFFAANQAGKTLSGGSEVAMHATGRYPEWWPGYRFARRTVGWVSGVTVEATRDGCQRILLGRAGELGTGTIPERDIIGTPLSRQGVADAIALCRVRSLFGGTSTIIFKSYDQGRTKWQGDTIDYVWFDEEPPMEIYTEGLTRTNAGGAP